MSPEEFASGLAEFYPDYESSSRELSIEEFAAGIADLVPEAPGHLATLGRGALDMFAQGAGLLDIASEKVGEWTGTEPSGLFRDAEALLRGGSQALVPEEQRGRGGLAEDIERTVGAVSGCVLGAAALIWIGRGRGDRTTLDRRRMESRGPTRRKASHDLVDKGPASQAKTGRRAG